MRNRTYKEYIEGSVESLRKAKYNNEFFPVQFADTLRDYEAILEKIEIKEQRVWALKGIEEQKRLIGYCEETLLSKSCLCYDGKIRGNDEVIHLISIFHGNLEMYYFNLY